MEKYRLQEVGYEHVILLFFYPENSSINASAEKASHSPKSGVKIKLFQVCISKAGGLVFTSFLTFLFSSSFL